MSIIPSFQYLLVMPSGNIKGFNSESMAKAFVNNYYYHRTRDNGIVSQFNDLTNNYDDMVDTMCYKMGVEEGECRLYNTTDIIEKIQDELVFDDEKEEVISKLLSSNIELNIFDYAIDNIFTNTDSINIMEQYGSPITGE